MYIILDINLSSEFDIFRIHNLHYLFMGHNVKIAMCRLRYQGGAVAFTDINQLMRIMLTAQSFASAINIEDRLVKMLRINVKES